MKFCTKCDRNLSNEKFFKDRAKKDGLTSWCKDCRMKYQRIWRSENRKKHNKYQEIYRKKYPEKVKSTFLKYKYGIDYDEYKKLYKLQNNKCAICGNKEKAIMDKKIKRLAVDHNHKTGKVRGLLCTNCNRMLGNSKDNPLILIKGIKYLIKNKR